MSEALRQEWWYDDDRQALMIGSWPYGSRATADHWGALRAALEASERERDRLREALEECVATAADCRANLTPIGGYKDLLPYPTYRRVWDASYNAEQKAFAALDAALATAPNTKDGEG